MTLQKRQSTEAAARRSSSTGGTRVTEVSNKLRELIVSGAFEVGDKLLTEAALTREYKASRTVVREAVASLRAAGLVEVRHGVGVFVCEPMVPPNSFRPVDRERISSMIELLELRSAIEIEAAGLAAERRSPAQEEALFECFDEIDRLVYAGDGTVDADRDFHLAIADATNNPRFRECLVLLGAHMIPRSALSGGKERNFSTGYLEQIQTEHQAIITVISEQDSTGARRAMRAHLKSSKDRYRRLIRKK